MLQLTFASLIMGVSVMMVGAASALEWSEVSGGEGTPKLVVLSNAKAQPESLPFIPERARSAGLWQSYADPKIVAKLGETMIKAPDAGWEETGLWMHLLLADGSWAARPVCQSAGAANGAVSTGHGYYALHATLWKNLQSTRPAPTRETVPAAAEKARTGRFMANLGEFDGQPLTPDDRKLNPFLDYQGDPAKEEAHVEVPARYDGSKPYGLLVYISPIMNGSNNSQQRWREDLEAHNIIFIGARNGGNNQPGNRRVWLAQRARAWALHHYRIDPSRMIVGGFSNGGDAASATAVATPFGFNNAILFAPPSAPPLGSVVVPQEKDATGPPVVIKPLSSSGISNIKKTWRIAYVCGKQDGFLSTVKKSADAVKSLDYGSKLFEIDGLGHGTPDRITDILEFIFSPRNAAKGKSGQAMASTFNPDQVLVNVRNAAPANPARARELMTQLWNNHPEVRTNPDVLEVLAGLEKLP